MILILPELEMCAFIPFPAKLLILPLRLFDVRGLWLASIILFVAVWWLFIEPEHAVTRALRQTSERAKQNLIKRESVELSSR